MSARFPSQRSETGPKRGDRRRRTMQEHIRRHRGLNRDPRVYSQDHTIRLQSLGEPSDAFNSISLDQVDDNRCGQPNGAWTGHGRTQRFRLVDGSDPLQRLGEQRSADLSFPTAPPALKTKYLKEKKEKTSINVRSVFNDARRLTQKKTQTQTQSTGEKKKELERREQKMNCMEEKIPKKNNRDRNTHSLALGTDSKCSINVDESDSTHRSTIKNMSQPRRETIEFSDDEKATGDLARSVVEEIEKSDCVVGSFNYHITSAVSAVKKFSQQFLSSPSEVQGCEKKRKLSFFHDKSKRNKKKGTPINVGASLSTKNAPQRNKSMSDGPGTLTLRENFRTPVVTRSASKQHRQEGNSSGITKEIIALDDDDDDNDDKSDTEKQQQEKEFSMDSVPISRIAIGPYIARAGCTVGIKSDGNLYIEYIFPDTSRTRRKSDRLQKLEIRLDEDVCRIEFYTTPADARITEHGSFVAFTTTPIGRNKIKSMAKSFDLSSQEHINRYLIVEFDDPEPLNRMVGILRRIPSAAKHLQIPLNGLDAKDICVALLNDSRIEAEPKKNSDPEASTSKFLLGKSDDEEVLVYPFHGDQGKIEAAAEGLKVLGCFEAPTDDLDFADRESSDAEEGATGGRAHYLTITVGDCHRLVPGKFLNDTLIDFFMRWMDRHASDSKTPVAHYFSTHFYSALCKSGPEGVQRWTAKKGIDVFERRFIFVPVNKSLHWSLAIIVNPGAIEKHAKWLDEQVEEASLDKGDGPYPMIMFFDSLKCHPRNTVAKNLRRWLNAEWNRKLGDSDGKSLNPFTANTMKAVAPKVPIQTNGYDCGVYVCRYAYGITKLKNNPFSRMELGVSSSKVSDIGQEFFRDNPVLNFGRDDICDLREEFLTLIERLSEIYLSWKKEQSILARKEKERQRAEKMRETNCVGTNPACDNETHDDESRKVLNRPCDTPRRVTSAEQLSCSSPQVLSQSSDGGCEIVDVQVAKDKIMAAEQSLNSQDWSEGYQTLEAACKTTPTDTMVNPMCIGRSTLSETHKGTVKQVGRSSQGCSSPSHDQRGHGGIEILSLTTDATSAESLTSSRLQTNALPAELDGWLQDYGAPRKSLPGRARLSSLDSQEVQVLGSNQQWDFLQNGSDRITFSNKDRVSIQTDESSDDEVSSNADSSALGTNSEETVEQLKKNISVGFGDVVKKLERKHGPASFTLSRVRNPHTAQLDNGQGSSTITSMGLASPTTSPMVKVLRTNYVDSRRGNTPGLARSPHVRKGLDDVENDEQSFNQTQPSHALCSTKDPPSRRANVGPIQPKEDEAIVDLMEGVTTSSAVSAEGENLENAIDVDEDGFSRSIEEDGRDDAKMTIKVANLTVEDEDMEFVETV